MPVDHSGNTTFHRSNPTFRRHGSRFYLSTCSVFSYSSTCLAVSQDYSPQIAPRTNKSHPRFLRLASLPPRFLTSPGTSSLPCFGNSARTLGCTLLAGPSNARYSAPSLSQLSLGCALAYKYCTLLDISPGLQYVSDTVGAEILLKECQTLLGV